MSVRVSHGFLASYLSPAQREVVDRLRGAMAKEMEEQLARPIHEVVKDSDGTIRGSAKPRD